MNSQRLKALCAAVAFTLSMMTVQAQAASVDRNAVVDKEGGFVQDSWGGCVRTKWSEGIDPCAPKAVPQAQYQPVRPAPAPSLAQYQRTVYFDFDKDNLTPQARAELDSLINVIANSDDILKARIAGHADRYGSNEYNDELSRRRALAVQDYMANKGFLDTRVVQLQAFGKTQPVKDCDTHEARTAQINCLSPNRRVEVSLEYYR